MRTGIIGAMQEEITALLDGMETESRETIAGMTFYSGRIEGKQAVLVQSGIGKVNAGVCAQLLIEHYGVDEIINTGVAGSLNAEINIGDIVISTDAVQHDFSVEAIGFRKGEIPYTGLVGFPADKRLQVRAREAFERCATDARCFSGRICSGDQFIASRQQKERILADFGGLCCEMEGAAIAQVCQINAVPWVIIRAISDKADDSEEVSFETFKVTAASRCAAIVRELLRQDD